MNTHILSNAAKGVTTKFVPKVGSLTYEIASPKDLNIPLSFLNLYMKSVEEVDQIGVIMYTSQLLGSRSSTSKGESVAVIILYNIKYI